ncbi:MAG: hypothetical protein HYS36_05030 [Candidatus Rokubacteria bacterium]|nr:hypothetical protein [Candidatus Rokubacteria bacterium]
MLGGVGIQPRQLRLQGRQDLLAMMALPLGLLLVAADDVASPPLPRADHHLFDLARRIPEDEADIGVEQVGGAEEDLAFEGGAVRVEEIQGAVAPRAARRPRGRSCE